MRSGRSLSVMAVLLVGRGPGGGGGLPQAPSRPRGGPAGGGGVRPSRGGVGGQRRVTPKGWAPSAARGLDGGGAADASPPPPRRGGNGTEAHLALAVRTSARSSH